MDLRKFLEFLRGKCAGEPCVITKSGNVPIEKLVNEAEELERTKCPYESITRRGWPGMSRRDD